MARDRLHRVSWPAGELFIHGTTHKYLRQVVAEHLIQEDNNLIQIELAEEIDREKENQRAARS